MAEESYREFMCKLVYPGCEFAVRAKTDDEVIRLAHMLGNGSRCEGDIA